MGKEVVHGILLGLTAIVITVTIGSFVGKTYSRLAHHGGGHGASKKHPSDSQGEKHGSSSDSSHGSSSESSKSGNGH